MRYFSFKGETRLTYKIRQRSMGKNPITVHWLEQVIKYKGVIEREKVTIPKSSSHLSRISLTPICL
jgi:hypothetical protein